MTAILKSDFIHHYITQSILSIALKDTDHKNYALPVSPETRAAANELEQDIDSFVLFGGEDAELLFTLPEAQVEAFSKVFHDFVVIGKIGTPEDKLRMQTAEGSEMTLT